VADVALRAAEERDVESAGDVLFVATYRSALLHGLPTGGGGPADSRRYVRWLRELDPQGGVIAERDGEVVGLGWAHRRGPLATVGPVAVEPRAQGGGVGRRLLERCLETAGAGLPQVRLVQPAHEVVALGLALRAGFRIVAPLLELELPAGAPVAIPDAVPGVTVRAARDDDRLRILARDARAFGAERAQSLDRQLATGRVLVAERGRTLVGYAGGLALGAVAQLGAAAADDGDVLLRLLAAVGMEIGAGELALRTVVPATDRRLVAGLVDVGFRVFRAAHYLVRGGGTAPPPNYVLMGADLM